VAIGALEDVPSALAMTAAPAAPGAAAAGGESDGDDDDDAALPVAAPLAEEPSSEDPSDAFAAVAPASLAQSAAIVAAPLVVEPPHLPAPLPPPPPPPPPTARARSALLSLAFIERWGIHRVLGSGRTRELALNTRGLDAAGCQPLLGAAARIARLALVGGSGGGAGQAYAPRYVAQPPPSPPHSHGGAAPSSSSAGILVLNGVALPCAPRTGLPLLLAAPLFAEAGSRAPLLAAPAATSAALSALRNEMASIAAAAAAAAPGAPGGMAPVILPMPLPSARGGAPLPALGAGDPLHAVAAAGGSLEGVLEWNRTCVSVALEEVYGPLVSIVRDAMASTLEPADRARLFDLWPVRAALAPPIAPLKPPALPTLLAALPIFCLAPPPPGGGGGTRRGASASAGQSYVHLSEGVFRPAALPAAAAPFVAAFFPLFDAPPAVVLDITSLPSLRPPPLVLTPEAMRAALCRRPSAPGVAAVASAWAAAVAAGAAASGSGGGGAPALATLPTALPLPLEPRVAAALLAFALSDVARTAGIGEGSAGGAGGMGGGAVPRTLSPSGRASFADAIALLRGCPLLPLRDGSLGRVGGPDARADGAPAAPLYAMRSGAPAGVAGAAAGGGGGGGGSGAGGAPAP
jgi:hypothetical protein